MSRTKVAKPVNAIYERDGNSWIVELAEEPRCHSWGRTIQEARRNIRDAAGLWFEVDPKALEIVDNVRPPTEVIDAIETIRMSSHQLETVQVQLRSAWEDAACILVDKAGLSMRDAAAVLGVSHQRVNQLLRK